MPFDKLSKIILGIALFIFLSVPAVHSAPTQADFELVSSGDAFVDYEKFGRFTHEGEENFACEVTDPAGLEAALGDGVYPSRSIEKDPEYQKFVEAHPKINVWEYAYAPVVRDSFYAWCQFHDFDGKTGEGAKLFFIGETLREAGLLNQALKSYYALIVNFPKTVVWSGDGGFYWYPAPEAVSRIRKICATTPELGLSYEGGFVDIDYSLEGKPELDRVKVWPGRFVKAAPLAPDRAAFKITESRGRGKVRVVQYNNRDWELLVEGKPFVVKGVTYSLSTVGESAHARNLKPWMTVDRDHNSKNDGMSDSWVDKNHNNLQDPDEPTIGDAELLKQMGANTLRIYHQVAGDGRYDPGEYDKPLMRSLNREQGIYFIMGDFLGAYTVGSGADWKLGTDYTDPAQRERMKQSVRDMVLDHRSEPYVLMWLLGNENQHPHSKTNAHDHPEIYAKFLNEVARMIHELDPDHPVAVCNLNSHGLKDLGKFAPQIDIYGANVYSGAYSMGSIWQLVKRYFDRPILFTEMGADAYMTGKGPDEEGQSDYFLQNWEDICLNLAGRRGEGNGIGGVVFEWMDEWWKGTQKNSWGNPDTHETDCDNPNAPYDDGCSNEEWFGIFGQGDGVSSPFLREPRKIYDTMKQVWTKKEDS